MATIHEVLRLFESEIGNLGDPLSPIQQFLSRYNIEVNDATIYRWRSGELEGDETAVRVLSALILEGRLEPQHAAFFSNVVNTGLMLRTPQKKLSHRYNSEGFTASIGNELQLRDQQVRQALRGLRTDMIWNATVNPALGDIFVYTLRNAKQDFITAYTSPDLNYPSQINSTVAEFADVSDGGTVGGFYAKLNYYFGEQSGRSAGIFVPYECDVLKVYVDDTLTSMRLTPYIQAMLTSCANGESMDRFAAVSTNNTGIPNDSSVIGVTRAAVFGEL